ncbi:serine/threonine-protein kinase [Actinomadura sp. NBRC 104425]|uniref:serine/threonine-protein kinase n=1 Tax=Actinomadura sp. NBRC 104425 TaxID=3032204 RepID=UPI0025554F7D|nr:serine/threonine-protein kinase [Actinomadura sp. NBRC 104425]
MVNPVELRAGDPRTVGPYRLLALLGEGGQGAVYLGEDTAGTRVAVKVLHARLAGDDRARHLFLRESSIARRVEPYCTARVLAAGVEDDRPYIVSEYVEGESLSDLVRRAGPRDHGSLERLAIGTAAALNGIHRAGIVHRDFKPSNVLLATDGPRVIDFGIARAVTSTTTLSSGIVGTPAYMSPEQVAGQEVGPPSDVFSWAVTLTFAATGAPVFGSDAIPAVFNRILNAAPDLSAMPPHRRDLLAACLDKVPERRPTMSQVLAELLGEAPAPRPHVPPPSTYRPPAAAVGPPAPPFGAPAHGAQPPAVPVPATARLADRTNAVPPGSPRPLPMGVFLAGTLLQLLVGVAITVFAVNNSPDYDGLITVEALLLAVGVFAIVILRRRAHGGG